LLSIWRCLPSEWPQIQIRVMTRWIIPADCHWSAESFLFSLPRAEGAGKTKDGRTSRPWSFHTSASTARPSTTGVSRESTAVGSASCSIRLPSVSASPCSMRYWITISNGRGKVRGSYPFPNKFNKTYLLFWPFWIVDRNLQLMAKSHECWHPNIIG